MKKKIYLLTIIFLILDIITKILAVKYNEVDVHDTYIQTKLNNETAYYNLLGNRVDKSTIEELKEKK